MDGEESGRERQHDRLLEGAGQHRELALAVVGLERGGPLERRQNRAGSQRGHPRPSRQRAFKRVCPHSVSVRR